MNLEILKNIRTVAMIRADGPDHLAHYSAWPMTDSVLEIAQAVYQVPCNPSEEGLAEQAARGRILSIDNTKALRLISLDEAHAPWEVKTDTDAWKSLRRHWLRTGAYRRRVARYGAILFASRKTAGARRKAIADGVTPAKRTGTRIGHGATLYLGWTQERDHASTGTSWQTGPDRKGALVLPSTESAAALRTLIASANASAPARRKTIRAEHDAGNGYHVWRVTNDDRVVYLGWIEER